MPIVTTDFFGTVRPQSGQVDIGFHEYSLTNNTNTASFTFTYPVNAGEVKVFTNNSTTVNPITAYDWSVNLGSGFTTIGTSNNLSYTFADAGIFQLKLSITTIDGVFTKTENITVSDTGSYGCTNNVLLNGDFTTNTTNWAKGGNDVSFVWNSGAVDVTINALNVANRFYQEFTLPVDWVIGKEIAISFDAKSNTAGKKIELELHDVDAAGKKIATDLFFNLTTTTQTYTGIFVLSENPVGPNVHFRFAFKTADTNSQTVTLDNICLGEYTLGSIEACIDPFTAVVNSPVSIDFSSSCSTATGEIETYLWEIPGHISSSDIDQVISFNIDKCGVYDINLSISGPDGSSTKHETLTVTGCSNPVGNLITEPNFENEVVGLWNLRTTGNNTSVIDSQYSSGYFQNNYIDNNGNIFVETNLITLNKNTQYNFIFKSYAPYKSQGFVGVIIRDAANNILLEDVVTLQIQEYTEFNATFDTFGVEDVVIQFNLNGIESVHLYEVRLLEGVAAPVVDVPTTTNKYTIDNNGNVSYNGSNNVLVSLFGLSTYINPLAHLFISYNIFTGLGQIIEPISGQVLLFNIDTGNYVIYSDMVSNVILRQGTTPTLAKYGNNHPVEPASLLVNRGEDYWDWYQLQQNALYGNTIVSWPTLFETQYQKAQTI